MEELITKNIHKLSFITLTTISSMQMSNIVVLVVEREMNIDMSNLEPINPTSSKVDQSF